MYKWLVLIGMLGFAGVTNARMMGGGMMGTEASPPVPPAKDSSADIKKGYSLVQTFCVQCHQSPNPAQHSAADWPVVLSRMQQYMQQQHRPVPTPSDRTLILKYLDQAHE